MAVIRADHMGFRYGSNGWVLRDISLEVQQGDFIGIIGPNGSGKTTLLRLLDGLLIPQEGCVHLDGIPVGRMKRDAVARTIAVVPQDSTMVFPFTVHEVVLMGRAPHLRRWEFERERDLQIVRRAMERTDTAALANRSMNALSGGERQRVLIARALAQEPKVMLLDEPTAFLDIRHQVEFFDLIKTLNREQRLSVLAVTHDVNLAALYCDRIVLLHGGAIHSMGRPGEVITAENIREVYGIEVIVEKNALTGLPQITPLSEEYRAAMSAA
ncbi:MAG: heme ABC transporter ATP-binding protein [Syntrophaceae bacterium]|nr:heme ABC transporter ATP-binding protein [Syntrophaceae bacterium]